MHPTNFTEQNKKFFLSLHYNGDNNYWFVNSVPQVKFKIKDSEIKRIPLCLGNVGTQFCVTNMVKTGLFGNVHDFSIDYQPVSTSKIYDIHRYLMKKTVLYKMFGLIKKLLLIVLISTVNS